VKKCIVEIAQEHSLSIKKFTFDKYKVTALKRTASLLAKLIELYPNVAGPLIIQQLLEKIPHKNTGVETLSLYYNFVFDVARLCPNQEEKILEAVVERLC
jgi:hypothetical protein